MPRHAEAMTVLLLLQLAVLPLSALLVVVTPGYAMWQHRQWPALAVAAWAAALCLLVVWVEAGYRSGVAADENGTVGNIYDELQWLLDAVLAAGASIALTLRRAGRTASA